MQSQSIGGDGAIYASISACKAGIEAQKAAEYVIHSRSFHLSYFADYLGHYDGCCRLLELWWVMECRWLFTKAHDASPESDLRTPPGQHSTPLCNPQFSEDGYFSHSTRRPSHAHFRCLLHYMQLCLLHTSWLLLLCCDPD